MVTSVEHLCGILHDWRHLNSHKSRLFEFCKELLKSLDDLRQEMMVEDDVEEVQPVYSGKIKIPALKQKVDEEDPVDVRPPKRQCRGQGVVEGFKSHV